MLVILRAILAVLLVAYTIYLFTGGTNFKTPRGLTRLGAGEAFWIGMGFMLLAIGTAASLWRDWAEARGAPSSAARLIVVVSFSVAFVGILFAGVVALLWHFV